MINLITGFLIGIACWFLGGKIIAWRWPYQAMIAEKRGKAIRWVFDRAARFKDKKDPTIQRFRLRKSSKVPFSPTPYKSIHIDKKGRNVLPLYNPEEGQYFSMDVHNPPTIIDSLGNKKEGKAELAIQDKDISFYGALQREIIKTKYATESWIQKWGALVGILAVCGILAFIVIWLGGVFLQVGNQVIQAMHIASDTASKLAQAGPPVPQPPAPLGG